MKKLSILLFIVLIIATNAKAQYHLSTSSYYINGFSINPAFSAQGEDLFLSFQANKYSGSQGSKGLDYVSFGGYYNLGAGLATGLTANSQHLGDVNYTSLDLSMSYKAELSKSHYFAFALSSGIYREKLDLEGLSYSEYVDMRDPLLQGGEVVYDRSKIQVGAGGIYNFNSLQVGLFIPHLLNGNQSFQGDFIASVKYMYNDKPMTKVKVGNYGLFNYQSDGSYLYDAGLLVDIHDAVLINVGYRSTKEISSGIFLRISEMQVGYNNNYSFGDFSGFITTKHEISVIFKTNKLQKFRILRT